MRTLFLKLTFLIFFFSSCGKEPTSISITQSADLGNQTYNTVFATNLPDIRKVEKQNKFDSLLTEKLIITNSLLKYLGDYVSQKCVGKRKNDQYVSDFILIRIEKGDQTEICYIEGKDAIRTYFKSLIVHLKKYSSETEIKDLQSKFQNIIEIIDFKPQRM